MTTCMFGAIVLVQNRGQSYVSLMVLHDGFVSDCISATTNNINFDSLVQNTCCYFFCAPVPMFLCILDSLGLVSTSRYGCMTATLSWKQLLARLFRTVDGCCWVTLVSDSSELTARHLPISKGNKLDASFICCTKFP